MIVVATDKGTPKLFTEKTITIVVDDENDNSPDVISLNSVLLLPGTPKGTTLTTIRAIDEDASSNGIVTFKFAGEGTPTSRGFLSLDQHTGQIILSRRRRRRRRQSTYRPHAAHQRLPLLLFPVAKNLVQASRQIFTDRR